MNKAVVTSEMSFNTSYNYTQSQDVTLAGYFVKVFENDPNKYLEKLKETFQTTIENYYKNEAQKSSVSFPLELNNPNSNYSVDLLFLEKPLYDRNRGVIYYYCGEVQKDISSTGFLTEPVKDHNKWDSFNTADGNFQIFLSTFLLEQLVQDVSGTGSLKFRLDKLNLPPKSSFKLNIESLGSIIPGNLLIILNIITIF